MTTRHRIHVVVFAFALFVAPFGCSLLAPSDEELMGGLTTNGEGGSGGNDGGDASRDSQSDTSVTPPCDAGGNGASCTSGDQCCSGKCRGNGLCL